MNIIRRLKNIECKIINHGENELLLKVINSNTKRIAESVLFKSPNDEDIDIELNRLIIKTM
ncbi:hypothetical protein H9L25_00645 [Terrisporobacter mayombei]|nr:hypothetical protein [Terrisporobacter mayombei]